MKLNALVVARNAGDLKVLVAAFAELAIEYRVCMSPSEAMDLLATSRYSALIIDFDVPNAVQVARMAHEFRGKQKPILFGMIGANTPIAGLYEAGGNFALYKPLDLLQLLHSLRAGSAFMQKDRRAASRQGSETLAYLELPGGTIPALVQNLTEDGISLQAAEELMPMRSLPFRFLLPGTTEVIRATGQIIWTDKTGRAGVLFTSIPAACRRDLAAWLQKHEAKRPQLIHTMTSPRSRSVVATH